MPHIDVYLDSAVFSHCTAVATAHRHSGQFAVGVNREDRHWVLRFAAENMPADEAALAASIMRDALDGWLNNTTWSWITSRL